MGSETRAPLRHNRATPPYAVTLAISSAELG
jgi:hypothetical protein